MDAMDGSEERKRVSEALEREGVEWSEAVPAEAEPTDEESLDLQIRILKQKLEAMEQALRQQVQSRSERRSLAVLEAEMTAWEVVWRELKAVEESRAATPGQRLRVQALACQVRRIGLEATLWRGEERDGEAARRQEIEERAAAWLEEVRQSVPEVGEILEGEPLPVPSCYVRVARAYLDLGVAAEAAEWGLSTLPTPEGTGPGAEPIRRLLECAAARVTLAGLDLEECFGRWDPEAEAVARRLLRCGMALESLSPRTPRAVLQARAAALEDLLAALKAEAPAG